MYEKIIDAPDKLTDNALQKCDVLIIGIGIFYGFLINNLSYLIGNLLRELLMFFSIQPILNFWLKETFIYFGIMATSKIFFTKLSRGKYNKWLLFRNIILLFFLSSFLVFLFKNFAFSLMPNKIIQEMIIFNREILDNNVYKFLLFAFECLSYITVIVLLMKNGKFKKLVRS